jgi:hypothetical protein
VTWKPDTFFLFWVQNPMYVGCNGETCIYTCCKFVRVRICEKILFLSLGSAKGTSSLHREMEKTF